MRARRAAACLWLWAVAATAAGCAGGRPPPGRVEPGWSQTGEASWYGPGFHGRPTASGEPFDMEAPTAAHRWLPFGTRVRVENLANGRRTLVRVNDRGPFAHDRILDVSRAAARDLDMLGTGTAPVRIVVLALPDPGCREVQVGAFRDPDNAAGLERRLERDGVPARREPTADGLVRVVAGPFSDPARIRRVRQRWGGLERPCGAGP